MPVCIRSRTDYRSAMASLPRRPRAPDLGACSFSASSSNCATRRMRASGYRAPIRLVASRPSDPGMRMSRTSFGSHHDSRSCKCLIAAIGSSYKSPARDMWYWSASSRSSTMDGPNRRRRCARMVRFGRCLPDSQSVSVARWTPRSLEHRVAVMRSSTRWCLIHWPTDSGGSTVAGSIFHK